MGVRLYLNTNDVAVLEECAGVPAGTNDRLQALKKSFVPKTADAGYELYCAVQADAELAIWEHFQLFGFGKFDNSKCVRFGLDPYVGEAKDMDALILFNSSFKGFHSAYDELERIVPLVRKYGVCWS